MHPPTRRHFATGFALLGLVIHAWLFANHLASHVKAAVTSRAPAIEICHGDATATIADPFDDGAPAKGNSDEQCPICEGLATLHIGIPVNISSLPFVPQRLSKLAFRDDARRAVSDRLTPNNRGPPLQI
jgi:Protein of unknown function (DUF2946)